MELPTKSNLIKIKKSIALSKQGHELLEKKRFILMHEKEKREEDLLKIEKEMKEKEEEAFMLFKKANVEIGINDMRNIASSIVKDNSIDVKNISVMGVEIPSINYDRNRPLIRYGLYETSEMVDKAVIAFYEFRLIFIKYVELKTSIERLNEAIIKVQKRASALKNIIIPKDEETEKYISDVIDEREREEFSRLKIIKRKML
ncbi:MAG: V-type ATP synthase subunit D [Clostridia bacterium]|nr:V-type ATP synthase subunit D [Clostridia bacterium]